MYTCTPYHLGIMAELLLHVALVFGGGFSQLMNSRYADDIVLITNAERKFGRVVTQRE